jgi:hypothetical protein
MAGDGAGSPLSDAEIAALAAEVDSVGHGGQVEQELQALAGALESLAAEEAAAAGPDPRDGVGDADAVPPEPGAELTVIATAGAHQRRKELLDRLVFHRALHDLRTRPADGPRGTLIVAGADRLGVDALETLTRQARRTGTRLILLMERLRQELEELLGGPDCASILMRLGNAREAAAAAQFIGREHRFVLSQLTVQVGQTFTEGVAQSRGSQESVSEGTTSGTNASFGGFSMGEVPVPIFSFGSSSSRTTTTSRAETWQNTVNQSTSDTTTRGATGARSYDFAVEPTAIQGLPATAFILVEAGAARRRVVLADCNPGIALLERVAPAPLSVP